MSTMRFRLPAVVVAVLAGLVTFGAPAAAAGVVSPSNPQGWTYAVEAGTPPPGGWTVGPGAPPTGIGSFRLATGATGDGAIVALGAYLGLPLDAIEALSYSTYRVSGDPALAISLQFNVDTDVTDDDLSWQGRLVYEPYYTYAVQTGVWQTWNTLDNAAGGNWWFSGAPGNGFCPIGNPCTWAEVLAAFPDAGIHPTLGAVLFKAGSGWNPFVGNVDAFTLNGDFYDFDIAGKDDCKQGGWQMIVEPSFGNQGDCVSTFAG